MNERRSLVEGLKPASKVDPGIEKSFVFGSAPPAKETVVEELPVAALPNHNRSPFSTRVRTDIASALKRASLERQLSGTTPNTLQDILEQALAAWLAEHGYLEV